METFARQAAIAIDNVRLFNETKEALDRAKAEHARRKSILSAISSSIADTKPVIPTSFSRAANACSRGDLGSARSTLVRDEWNGSKSARSWPDQAATNSKKAFPPRPVNRDTASG